MVISLNKIYKLNYKLNMSQQCEALANKNNVVKQLYWHVFTGEKASRQGIPKSIVFSTGQPAFGIWSERLECTRLRTR